MITAARPIHDGPAHWYRPGTGEAVWTVPNKSKPGEFRKTTLKDARAQNLLPSPTGIVRLLHRHALVEWMVEQAVLAAITTPRKIINGLEEPLDQFVERVIHTERVQDEERNVAADKGIAIHRAIQAALQSETDNRPGYDPELALFVIPALRDLNKIGRVVATEKTIVGDGYCGMTDVVLENDHEFWVGDIKSCRKIPDKPYDEQLLQVSAYAGGLGNTGNKRIRGMLLYVSTTEPGLVKAVECTEWEKDYRRFRLLLEFYKLTTGLSGF